MGEKIVNLVGGRGYTGSELLGLLVRHPQMDLGIASSRSEAGQELSSICDSWPRDGRVFTRLEPTGVTEHPADAWVLALPNNLASEWVGAIHSAFPGSVILDLSADYRFDSAWTYGLPERFREEISAAKLISNPGCYATGSQLGLLPVIEHLDETPVIFGVSGYSGAGKTPSRKNDPEVLRDNLLPYALSGHVHESEVSYQLGRDVRFMPHVAAFFRGISLTISFRLGDRASAEELQSAYGEFYRGEPRIKVTREIPEVRQVQGTPDVLIGGFSVDARDGHRACLVVVLDNLLKGAASQAMQNLNLALGLNENAGIDT
jgi:N-acetyl-gamma-glutamyl-phosphate reductase